MPLKFSTAAGVCNDNESSICGTMQRTSAAGELAWDATNECNDCDAVERTSNHDDLDERDDGELNERRSWTTLTKPRKFSFMWVQSWLA